MSGPALGGVQPSSSGSRRSSAAESGFGRSATVPPTQRQPHTSRGRAPRRPRRRSRPPDRRPWPCLPVDLRIPGVGVRRRIAGRRPAGAGRAGQPCRDRRLPAGRPGPATAGRCAVQPVAGPRAVGRADGGVCRAVGASAVRPGRPVGARSADGVGRRAGGRAGRAHGRGRRGRSTTGAARRCPRLGRGQRVREAGSGADGAAAAPSDPAAGSREEAGSGCGSRGMGIGRAARRTWLLRAGVGMGRTGRGRERQTRRETVVPEGASQPRIQRSGASGL